MRANHYLFLLLVVGVLCIVGWVGKGEASSPSPDPYWELYVHQQSVDDPPINLVNFMNANAPNSKWELVSCHEETRSQGQRVRVCFFKRPRY